MEENRTFGIEMEFCSNISIPELSMKLDSALVPTGHTTVQSGYCHNTDSTNLTRWTVKTDSSIRTYDMGDHRHSIEVVSPVLIGQNGLDALKVVCDVLSQHGKINNSCGLHVHHGVNTGDDLVAILDGWLKIEDTLYECLPVSRKTRPHAKPIRSKVSRLTPRAKEIMRSDLRTWWRMKLRDRNRQYRYWGINYESVWLRNTIEVRAAAGSVEYKKVANWAEATQRIIIEATQNPSWFKSGIDNVIAIIDGTANASSSPVRAIQVAPTFTVGTKSRYGHKLNSASSLLDDLLWEGNYLHALIASVITYEEQRSGEPYTYEQGKKRVMSHVSFLKRTGRTRISQNDNFFKAIDESWTMSGITGQASENVSRPVPTNSPSTEASPVSERAAEAATWLKARHNKFYPRHQAQAA
jgi:hypothetical protein